MRDNKPARGVAAGYPSRLVIRLSTVRRAVSPYVYGCAGAPFSLRCRAESISESILHVYGRRDSKMGRKTESSMSNIPERIPLVIPFVIPFVIRARATTRGSVEIATGVDRSDPREKRKYQVSNNRMHTAGPRCRARAELNSGETLESASRLPGGRAASQEHGVCDFTRTRRDAARTAVPTTRSIVCESSWHLTPTIPLPPPSSRSPIYHIRSSRSIDSNDRLAKAKRSRDLARDVARCNVPTRAIRLTDLIDRR